jgi:hypothetical protein
MTPFPSVRDFPACSIASQNFRSSPDQARWRRRDRGQGSHPAAVGMAQGESRTLAIHPRDMTP